MEIMGAGSDNAVPYKRMTSRRFLIGATIGIIVVVCAFLGAVGFMLICGDAKFCGTAVIPLLPLISPIGLIFRVIGFEMGTSDPLVLMGLNILSGAAIGGCFGMLLGRRSSPKRS